MNLILNAVLILISGYLPGKGYLTLLSRIEGLEVQFIMADIE